MTTESLIEFVKSELQQGVSREKITEMLLSQSWEVVDINEAFATVGSHNYVSTQSSATSSSPSISNVNSTVDSQPKNHKSNKILISVSIIVAVVLLGGVGAFAYYKYFSPQLSATDILKKSFITTISQTNSASFVSTTTGQAVAKITSGSYNGDYTSNFTIANSGSFDIKDKANPAIQMDFNLDSDIKSATNTDATIKLYFSNIIVGNALYSNIKNFQISYKNSDPNQIQIQAIVAMINGFVVSMENKWIEIATTTPGVAESQSKLSDADITAIRDYISGMSYVKSVDMVGSDNLNNISVYHIKLALQDDGTLVDLINKISLEKNPALARDPNYNDQLSNFKELLSKEIDLDLWIGKSGFRIYRVATQDISYSDPKSGASSSVKFDVSFGDYNNVKPISAPTDFTTLQSLMQNILGNMFPGVNVKK